MKSDKLYLIHISECIEKIEGYVKEGHDAFISSTLVQDAVIRNLQTLAESTQRLSDDIKNSHEEVDWRGISGFRNIVVHDYLGIDLEKCWQIVVRDLPPLKKVIKYLLSK